MILADFFSPITFELILKSIFFFIVLDIIGNGIADKLKFPKWLRLFYWVFGLGILVFVWFCLHFFIAFDSNLIWASLIFLCFPFLKSYFANKQIMKLFKEIILFPIPLLLLYPVAKSMIIALSLPPYIWDEMAYHYISPNQLIYENIWNFSTPIYENSLNLYSMLPRFLDTAYIIGFSLTKSYVLARFIHFFLFVSGVFVIGQYLKQKISFFSGAFFVLLAYYLTPSILGGSASGYIDSGTAIIQTVTIITLFDCILNTRKQKPYAFFSLVGLTIASKYTVLSSTLSMIILFSFIDIIKNKRLILENFNIYFKSRVKIVFYFILLSLIFGGYWYVKNLILTGNPIYPFIFSCINGLDCGSGQEFFSGWATEINFSNRMLIINSVFQDNLNIFWLTLASLLISVFIGNYLKNKVMRFFPLLIIAIIFVDLMLAKNISGFIDRYFYHWFLLIPIILSLPWKYVKIKKRRLFIIFTILLNIFVHFHLVSTWHIINENISSINSDEVVTPIRRNFASHKLSIDEWIAHLFPEMKGVINYCGNLEKNQDLIVIDPSLIWTSYEGLMRVYLVNCNIKILPPSVSIEDLTQDNNLIFTSLANCNKNSIDVIYNDRILDTYYELNQKLVCNAQRIDNHLYKFKTNEEEL